MDTPRTHTENPSAIDVDATLAGKTAELADEKRGDDVEEQPTARRELVDQTAPRPASEPAAQDSPRLRDVTGTFGSYVRGRRDALAGFVRTHRAATALLAVLAVAAVAALAIAFVQAGAVPGAEVVREDALARLSAPAYSSGTYGHDDVLVAREADVRSLARSGSASDDASAQFGASGYASAEVVVSYTGSFVSANQGATLEYACVDGTWAGIGEARDVQVAWSASTGVDQEKVVRNVHLLLGRADEQATGDGDESPSLVELYDGAKAQVTSEVFDSEAQTDTLEIRCERAAGYYSYTCDLTVSFAFRSAGGQWEVTEVSVADGARTRNLGPLMGTWEGTFQSQQTDGGKCLAAREAGLIVTIGEASEDELSGTVSGLAHYHEHPSDDAAGCEGDLAFENVPFTAKLTGGEGLTFEAALPEDVDGTATLTLRFGSEDDPDLVTGELKSAYPHTGSFLFFPVDETLVYTDLFTLRKTS